MTRLSWVLRNIIKCAIFILPVHLGILSFIVSTGSSFSCLNRTAGFYADTNAKCKMYYTCDEYGNKFTYHCPEETAFRQDALICDYTHLVHCTEKEYDEKPKINLPYKINMESINYTSRQNLDELQLKINCKMQHGFQRHMDSQGSDKSSNKAVTYKNKILNTVILSRNINNGTNTAMKYFTNMRTQFPTIVRRSKVENISIQSDDADPENKLDKKHTAGEYTYTDADVNTATYNFPKLSSNTFSRDKTNNDNNYLETVQLAPKNANVLPVTVNPRVANTVLTATEVSVHALTLSLKPLKPIELENDPYYPKFPTSTESFYTSTHDMKEWSYIRPSNQSIWSTIYFELPPALPDLNSLEDIVDRRKLLYIPCIKFN